MMISSEHTNYVSLYYTTGNARSISRYICSKLPSRSRRNKRVLFITGVPSSCVEKKRNSISWKLQALCDAVLSLARNRGEFERVIWKDQDSIANEIWSISVALDIPKYENLTRKINKTYSLLLCPSWFWAISAVLGLLYHHCYSCYKTRQSPPPSYFSPDAVFNIN